MKISRVVFRRAGPLGDRDDRLEDQLSGEPLSGACLQGINGSGKTTWLECVFDLWKVFSYVCRTGTLDALPPRGPLAHAGLVAMRLTGVPGAAQGLWVVYGDEDLWEAVPNKGDAPAAGVIITRRPARRRVVRRVEPFDDDGLAEEEREVGAPGAPLAEMDVRGRGRGTSQGDPGEWKGLLPREHALLRSLDHARIRLENPVPGGAPLVPLPNMVYLGAEDRYISPLDEEEDLADLPPERAFRWHYQYRAARGKVGHVEASLASLKLVDEPRFQALAEAINAALSEVELLPAFDPTRRRPLFNTPRAVRITLDRLSAGERAVIVALVSIFRWSTQGGIVLVDEPELHQHLSLMRRNLAAVDQVVQQRHGQLIVASHAPEVWKHWPLSQSIIRLDQEG